ncbi:tripartite tricarboxylate transporter substrate binding protein [Hydrogenophaga sp. OTU3427]|uniref:tripartite tricarboxylate transporter substrate binding protein n=1 Tax=Hydrogenophaga sp. OTU3427 TaxID=3043856 RepID=UPI00313A7E6C
MYLTRRALLCAAALAAGAHTAHAQVPADRFPSGPIKLVVNFPAGGNADLIGRVYARKLSEMLNVPVVVDNRGGAAGTLGADAVAKAPADGQTLLITPYSVFTNRNPAIRTAYNALDDFTPVAPLTVAPLVLATSATSQVTDMRDLATFAQGKRLSYGTYGPMTTTHIGQHRIARQLKAMDAVAVAYRGEAPMLADLLGGQIQMGVLSLATARENEKAGKIRLLGLISPQRSEFMPQLPTLRELGFPGVDWTDGVVVFASSKVPASTLVPLQDSSRKVLLDDDMLRTLRAQPNQPWLDMTPQALKAQMAADTAFWDKAQAEMGSTQ